MKYEQPWYEIQLFEKVDIITGSGDWDEDTDVDDWF